MKYRLPGLLSKACSMCLALTGILYWDKMSILLFGEPKFPENPDAQNHVD